MKGINLWLITFLCCLPISACTSDYDTLDCYYFNTEIHIEVYDSKLNNNQKQQINQLLDGLEKEFSANKTTSSVYQFNNLNKGESITISQRVKLILDNALELYHYSNKKFNPAVYPLSELWQFAPSFDRLNFNLPSEESINKVLESGVLEFEESSGQFLLTKNVQGAKIDLGGIVKGYASDQIASMLKSYGHTQGYVNCGSSSLNILSANSLGVVHPENTFEQLISINSGLKGTSISTSGDYQRFHVKDGVKYSHIIDANSGKPIKTGVVSATVVCDDGTFADAISTALCVCEYDNNIAENQLLNLMTKILKDKPSSQLYVVINNLNQKIILTNKEKGVDFTLLDSDYAIKKIS